MHAVNELLDFFQRFSNVLSRFPRSGYAVITAAVVFALLVLVLRVRTVSMRRGRFSLTVVFGNGPSPPANGASRKPPEILPP